VRFIGCDRDGWDVTTGWQAGNETTGGGSPGEQVVEFLGGELPAWFPPEILAWFIGVMILVVTWYVSKLAVRLAGRTVARRIQRPSVTRTVLRLVQLAVLLLGSGVAAGFVGFQAGDILLSVTVFSAVLGIVLAPIVGSIINGFFVLADQPYEIGDMIELADRGQTGFVEDITIRYTKIFTLDNTFIVISNDSIRDRDVINYSAEDERARLSLELIVTYEGDLDEARSLAENAAQDVEEVITGGPDIRIGSARYPAAPTCYIDTFGDHGVHLTLRYWTRQPYKLLTVRSKVQTNIWEALEDADVEIAYPHSHVVFDDTSGELNVAQRNRPDPADHFPAEDDPTDHFPADDDPTDREE
jgi:small-conductance mechanosensitive channel